MGVIKDGTISGYLPSTSTFAVHLPGYPSSLSRAVEVLGGIEGIQKACITKTNNLVLRFRPEDPYCIPAYGELRESGSNFLLRISKGSKKSGDSLVSEVPVDNAESINLQSDQSAIGTSACAVEDQGQLCADIVAQVPEAYHFDGMVDYQHVVAVHADMSRGKKRNWSEVEQNFEKTGLIDMDNEDLMLLVPQFFSAKDKPTTLVLSRPPPASSLKKNPEFVAEDIQVVMEKSLALDFKIKEIPKKLNWEEWVVPGTDEWARQTVVAKLFDERPIWPKKSLIERFHDMGLDGADIAFKRSCSFLVNVAYYFNNGPYLKFWIRKGYDPRKDPDSRIYQGIDFRVPQELQSFCDRAPTDEAKCLWTDICSFRVFPYKFHNPLQLFELEDDYIRQEIRNSPAQPTCSFKTGWFADNVLDAIRVRAMVRFLSVFPKSGAETLLKQASDRFERLKRMRFHMDISKRDKQKQVNEGEEEKEKDENVEKDDETEEKNEGADKEEDVEEEDEVDDNDEEEEFDAFDTLDDMAPEEGDISLQTYYPEMDNVSRTYLQELFGSFPSGNVEEAAAAADDDDELPNAAADDLENAADDGSDPEYQIYEQDSDDGYSDGYD